jgi:transaldolase
MNTPAANALLGKAAIANAILAYEAFEKIIASERWRNLEKKGAKVQRPLWASTGVKDPAYDDTRYVMELIAPHTVNTMPQATLDAVTDHGVFIGGSISDRYDEAHTVFTDLEKVGISISEVTDFLEVDGVEKFAIAWLELLDSVERVRIA